MNKLIKPIVLTLAVLLGLTLAKNMIAKASAETVCKAITGLELKIGGLDLSLIRSSLSIDHLKLFNPAGFPDRVMIDMPKIFAQIDRSSLTSGSPHLLEVRLHLKELLIEKNAEGKLNVMALKPESKKDESGKPAGKTPQIKIDLLNLKVEKVVYKDYTGGGSPRTQEFNVNLDETYRNITNINALAPLIIQKAIMNTTISSLANLNMGELVSNFSSTGVNMGSLGVEKLSGLTSNLATSGQELVSGVTKSISTSGVQEDVSKVAEGATSAVSGLLGSLTDRK